ncbi:MAG: phage tail protein [Acidimicrobiia bacterium]|nr:phage tail protein [Acidimicrobiia bacterium]
MAAVPIDEKYIANRYSVAIDGITDAVFKEVSGLEIEFEVTDEKDQAGFLPTASRKRPGRVKYGDIELKRNYGPDNQFYLWMKDVVDGKADGAVRKNGSVFMHDRTGAVIGEWQFFNAFISSWSVSDLDAGSDDVMEESIKLSVIELQRIS